jgi:exo-beta-1,3-glucanase (GH17 family)
VAGVIAPAWLRRDWLGRAICYSGYREGQSPDLGIYPSPEQVAEDLRLLARTFRLVRLFDAGPHAELVLEAIRRERLDLKVLLGGWLAAEADNPACPWGGVHGPERLAANLAENGRELERLARLARLHPETVAAVAVGNEACVEWTDHLVPPERVLGYVAALRREIAQPVTVCENHVPWRERLEALAAEVDFISLHTYPAWEARPVSEALDWTEENWRGVAERYPETPVIITEAGWTTASSGRGVRAEDASPENQAAYLEALTRWSRARGILTFVFEAFDEPWKGAPDPLEPEKHWGLCTVDRRPKPALRRIEAVLTAAGEPEEAP